jgi:hypothetical protein
MQNDSLEIRNSNDTNVNSSQLPRKVLGILIFLIVCSWLIFNLIPILISISIIDLHELGGVSLLSYLREALIALACTVAPLIIAYAKTKSEYNFTQASKQYQQSIVFCKLIIKATFPICLLIGIISAVRLRNGVYGDVQPLTSLENLLLYIPLFAASPIIVGTDIKSFTWRQSTFMVALPRLLVSMFGPRFVFMQIAIPTALLAIATNYKNNIKNFVKLTVGIFTTLLLLFVALPFLRKDNNIGINSLYEGSPMHLITLAESSDVFEYTKRPLFIPCGISGGSFNFIPFICPQMNDEETLVAKENYRFDFMLTRFIKQSNKLENIGTGGNPVLETGLPYDSHFGYIWFIFVGSTTAIVVLNIKKNIFAAFLFPHIAAKILFLWRGTIVEFFDRIPLILLTTILLLSAIELLRVHRHSTYLTKNLHDSH